MMNWINQNIEKWIRLDRFLSEQTGLPLIWITSNRQLHRKSLIEEFQSRFSNYDHQLSNAWGFDEHESMQTFLRALVENQIAVSSERPFVLHIPTVARYLPTIEDGGRTAFMAEIQYCMESNFQEWPFTVVFWSELPVKVRFEKAMITSKEFGIPHFHFETKKTGNLSSLPEQIKVPNQDNAPKVGQKWLTIIDKLEKKRASGPLGYADGDQLANAYHTVRNSLAETKCRIEMLENLKELTLESRYYQLYRTAQAQSSSGKWKNAKEYWEKSNEIYRKLYKTDSATGFYKVGQILCHLEDFKTAQQRFKTAMGLAKEQENTFIKGLVLKEQGGIAARNKDYQLAEELYWSSADVLLLDQESDDAQISMQLLAALWMSLERYEEAALVLIEAYNLFEYHKRGINYKLVQLLDFAIEKLGREREDELLLSLFDCGEAFQDLRTEIRQELKV